MFKAVWLCVLALALPCWTYPSGHITSCEEFGHGVSFDPVNAVGEWFAVYCFGDNHDNETKSTIRELTSSQLESNDQILKGYSKDKLKLEIKIHVSHAFLVDMNSVLVPLDDAGSVDAWITHLETETAVYVGSPIQRLFKWKSVDGFLVMMRCNDNTVYVWSKSATPDEDKLQRAVENLHIEGITGVRVYPSL